MPHYSPTAHVFSELDGLVIDGESRLLLYSRGRTQEEFPYSRTSLTTGEKSLIFAAWSVLDENGVSITYHMSLPDQAPVIAIHCGFDEIGRSFGYFIFDRWKMKKMAVCKILWISASYIMVIAI